MKRNQTMNQAASSIHWSKKYKSYYKRFWLNASRFWMPQDRSSITMTNYSNVFVRSHKGNVNPLTAREFFCWELLLKNCQWLGI